MTRKLNQQIRIAIIIPTIYFAYSVILFVIQFMLISDYWDSSFLLENGLMAKVYYSLFVPEAPPYILMHEFFSSDFLYCNGTGGPTTVCTIFNPLYLLFFFAVGIIFYFIVSYLLNKFYKKIKQKYAKNRN